MATTRKSPAKKPAAATKPATRRNKIEPKVEAPKVQLTPEQRQAKLEAYHALSSAGLVVPEELAKDVEGWMADLNAQREVEAQAEAEKAAQRQGEIEEANQNGPWYVRNCYPAQFNLRLDRQTEKRRLELKPRGTPGDIHPIKDEDLKDPVLRQNLSIGLIEIIPAGTAQAIIEKQTTNMGARVHTPLAMLRNELGQTYAEGAVKVEAEFNSQGVTVAQIDPRLLQGQMHDREVGGIHGRGGLTRVRQGEALPHTANPEQATTVVRSGFVPTGGNPAIVQYGPHGLQDNAKAKAVDDLARRRGLQGPGAGLGEVQVVVEPVRRT